MEFNPVLFILFLLIVTLLIKLTLRYKAVQYLQPKYDHLRTNLLFSIALPRRKYFTDFGWRLIIVDYLVAAAFLVIALIMIYLFIV